MENKNRNIKINDRAILITVILLLVSSIFAPYLLTRESLIGISFEGKGDIGDVIGGVTAPFINLIAAILVFISFRQQVVANTNQTKVNNVLMKTTNHAYIEKLYKDIIANFDYQEANEELFHDLTQNLDNLYHFPTKTIEVNISSDIDYSKIFDLLNSVEFLIVEIDNHIKDQKMINYYHSKLSLFLSKLNILSIKSYYSKIDESIVIDENKTFYEEAKVIFVKVEGLNSKLKLYSKKNKFFVY